MRTTRHAPRYFHRAAAGEIAVTCACSWTAVAPSVREAHRAFAVHMQRVARRQSEDDGDLRHLRRRMGERAYNTLRRAGYSTVAQVQAARDADLLIIRGFGPQSLQLVRAATTDREERTDEYCGARR